MRISNVVFVIFLCENPYKRDADTDSVASASKMHQQGLKINFKLITHLTFDSEYQALLFLSFLECVFLQCFLVLKIQNGESEIYLIFFTFQSGCHSGVCELCLGTGWGKQELYSVHTPTF